MNEDLTKVVKATLASKLFTTPTAILLLLANRSGEGWVLSDIVEATGIEWSALSAAKKALRLRGLIREQYPERDGRVVKIYLTPAGVEKAEELWANLAQFANIADEWRKMSPPSVQDPVTPQRAETKS